MKGIETTNSKKVYQYTARGYFVKEFNNVIEAAKELRINSQSIYNVLQGRTKTAKNYQFSKEKVDCMPALHYIPKISDEEKEAKKEAEKITYQDLGIVTEPSNREFGRRKIRIESKKADFYINPNKPIDQVINRFYK